MKFLDCIIIFLSTIFISQNVISQSNNYVDLNLGVNSGFVSTQPSDLFIGGIELNPNYNILDGNWKFGVLAEILASNNVYDNGNFSFLYGLLATKRIYNMSISLDSTTNAGLDFGSLNFGLRYIKGIDSQEFLGGVIFIEVGQGVTFSITSDRDFHYRHWRHSLGFDIELIQLF